MAFVTLERARGDRLTRRAPRWRAWGPRCCCPAAAAAQDPVPTPTPTPPRAARAAGAEARDGGREGSYVAGKAPIALRGKPLPAARRASTPTVPGEQVTLEVHRDGKKIRTRARRGRRRRQLPREGEGRARRPLQRPRRRTARRAALAAARGPKVRSTVARAASLSIGERGPLVRLLQRGLRRARLRRAAQRRLRRGDRPRGDGVPQGQRHEPAATTPTARDREGARRQGRRSRSATRTPAATSRPTSRARCSR